MIRLPFSLPVLILLALTIGYFCYRDWRQQLPARSMLGSTRLLYQDGQWLLDIDGEQLPVVLTQATVWQWLVALNFREPGSFKRRRLLLLTDSCHADEFRRLRVLLRHFPVLAD